MSWLRTGHALDWGYSLFYLSLLLWIRRINGLADFSNYLSRIITSHSAHACDGQPLRLHCPRHSTISVQSAFYGSGEARLCQNLHPESSHRGQNHSCSAFTALQKLLSECQSHRDCQLSVNHLLFGKDPCPGTTKYLHVDYKCKPKTLVLRCKPPKMLNIYAAVYGRSLGHSNTCSSNKTQPPPFGENRVEAFPKGSRRPNASGAVMSDSLSTYAYIKEHSEMAALLFTSSVCVGLLITLLAISVRVSCWCHRNKNHRPNCQQTVQKHCEKEDISDVTDDTESSLVSVAERKTVVGWGKMMFVSEAAERAERIERRDMIIQEIWMNAYLNGSSCGPL
uniref:Eva-1 homolog C (C. elegans) n=1 Tax=Neogobius melanostomus TaxID=47308 RepID=A0A8C6WIG7_9GOBI